MDIMSNQAEEQGDLQSCIDKLKVVLSKLEGMLGAEDEETEVMKDYGLDEVSMEGGE
jgi:hypothetical protein